MATPDRLRGLARFLPLLLLGLTDTSCSDGNGRRTQMPTAADPVAAGSTTAASEASGGDPVDRSQPIPGRPGGSSSIAEDVTFPPRDQALAFRQELEATYRDVLRRPATSSFVDVEGDIVWTTEYLRYRVNGCSNADAISRVQAQIQGGSAQPVCAAFTGTTVDFPPRNEPFAFRTELERIYRDLLRRASNQVFVDAEGDIVWTSEYLRYRVNNCSHSEAVQRVIDQVRGGAPVQSACGPVTVPSGGVSDFLASISSDDSGPATLVTGGRPNAGAGPIITASGGGTLIGGLNQITLNASQPVDTIVVSVDDDDSSGSLSNRAMAIADSYFVLRLRTPRTTVILNVDLPGRAIGRRFSVQFAGSVGGGPLGPYASRPVMVQRCSYSVSPTAVTINGGPTGGQFAFDIMVNTQPLCRWTTSSQAFFILANPPTLGGPGIAHFGYLSNFMSLTRTGSVRISFVAPPGEPQFIDIPVTQLGS